MFAFNAAFFSDDPPRNCRLSSLTCASVTFPMANSFRRNLPLFYALRTPGVSKSTVGKCNCRQWGFLIVANQAQGTGHHKTATLKCSTPFGVMENCGQEGKVNALRQVG